MSNPRYSRETVLTNSDQLSSSRRIPPLVLRCCTDFKISAVFAEKPSR